MHNSNQNLSPGATSPTDITSDQEGTINKNSKDKDEEINKLNDQVQQLQENDTAAQLQDKDDEINKLNDQVQQLQQEKEKFETDNPNIANLQQQLKDKDEEINKLNDQVQQLQENDTAAQLQDKDDEINKLNDQVQQLQQEKAELQTKFDQEKQALEAKDKTTKQPKQGNGAKYTATIGMGLAAGLIAFTALERTVKLEMLVMIGIAVASALAVGTITYVALPSTQVNQAGTQKVNDDGKGK